MEEQIYNRLVKTAAFVTEVFLQKRHTAPRNTVKAEDFADIFKQQIELMPYPDTRLIIGTDDALHHFAKMAAKPHKYAALHPVLFGHDAKFLDTYHICEQSFCPVVCPMLEPRSGVFSPEWQHRIICCDGNGDNMFWIDIIPE